MSRMENIELLKTDAGRAESGLAEKLDCTVRVMAVLSGRPYLEAHSACKAFGRKNGHRFAVQNHLTGLAARLGFTIARCGTRSGTVRRFIADHPTGCYLLRIRGHVFVVADGSIVDNSMPKLGSRIKSSWQITRPAPLVEAVA